MVVTGVDVAPALLVSTELFKGAKVSVDRTTGGDREISRDESTFGEALPEPTVSPNVTVAVNERIPAQVLSVETLLITEVSVLERLL